MRTPRPVARRCPAFFLGIVLLAAGQTQAQFCNPVAYGDDVQMGTISAPNQENCYQFQGAIGDVVRVSVLGTFDRFTEIVNPDGTRLCSRAGNTVLDCTLTQAGIHRIAFRSASLVQTGDYWFEMNRLNPPEQAERTCYGNNVRGSIRAQADLACYTFPGTANSTIQLSLVGTFDRYAEIIDPAGARLCSRNGNGIVTCTFPTSGTYSIFVRSASLAQTGDYTIAIRCQTLPCECTAAFWNYGEGWPGTNGIPTLTATGNPVLGAGVDFPVSNSLGQDTDAFLMFGFARVEIDAGFGGTLLVGTPISIIPFRLPAAGVNIPFGVPNNTALCNVCAHLQVIEVDPGASHSLSFTPGLTIVLGN